MSSALLELCLSAHRLQKPLPFPDSPPPPFPGLGLLLRTAQNRLFLLLAGEVGEEACPDAHDLLSDLVPEQPPVNIWKL